MGSWEMSQSSGGTVSPRQPAWSTAHQFSGAEIVTYDMLSGNEFCYGRVRSEERYIYDFRGKNISKKYWKCWNTWNMCFVIDNV